ncbi:hypothetical protein [Paenibacillus alvei]|uniref:Uncharacterized protein n=1 Tax=Paenibacillus alvei TaxID=44250 RepID=A0AAP6ZVZ1_PAEAL|nr:hypothetical protein [Paenibacillus alvei]NOJ68941.1 hypothetical protein [Paenibacillus alvei]
MSIRNEDDRIPTIDEAVAHLLQSLSLEEGALGQLLLTEAEKAMAFVGKDKNFPSHPTPKEIVDYNSSVVQILDSMLMAEWLLLKKLNMVVHMEFLAPTRSSASKIPNKGQKWSKGDVFDTTGNDLDY